MPARRALTPRPALWAPGPRSILFLRNEPIFGALPALEHRRP